MLNDFHLLRPMWLLSLLPVVIVWFLLWRKQEALFILKQFVDPHLLTHLVIIDQKKRKVQPIYVLLLIWVLAVLSLSGPTWQKAPSPFADDEAGLVVILKVNSTMNATDVQPSRLARAKLKVKEVLKERNGSPTGLIVYSGSAHLVMPLTRDDRIASAMIEDLTPKLMPIDGDAFLEAVLLAQEMLTKAKVPGSILVIADTVLQSQVNSANMMDIKLPLQFLAIKPLYGVLNKGLSNTARKINVQVTELTADNGDVKRIVNSAKTKFTSVIGDETEAKWQDNGYAFLPLIAGFGLLWSRKGWVVK